MLAFRQHRVDRGGRLSMVTAPGVITKVIDGHGQQQVAGFAKRPAASRVSDSRS
jgi:hypothetical protein